MKAKLEFEYDNDDMFQCTEIERLIKTKDVYRCLWEYDQWLSGLIKYGTSSKAKEKTYQECRTQLWTYLKDYNISLEV